MPRLIISFDMNSGKPKSSAARKAFEDKLKELGWKNEILVGETWETLPDTTLVSSRTDADALADVTSAETAAKRIEPAFVLEKHVISLYRRLDSRSDATRRKLVSAQDFMRRLRTS
ncbi:hypothetical protein [Methylorubrum thiocyanatum]|uniref:hypothetical protein n=1 Tax=Methylorubrum thiocyanatum TaxID=47958 RepID=UPI00398C3907